MSIRGYTRYSNSPITEQVYFDVGPDEFYLVAYRDPCAFLAMDFSMTSGSGYSLREGVDFEFSTIDNFYSDPLYENIRVASTIRIINETFQTGDLLISYRWVADYASADMFNRFNRAIDQMTESVLTTVDGGVVVNDDGNLVVQGTNYPGYKENL